MNQGNNTPVFGFCRNCGHKIMGFRNKDGLMKMECPYCHTRYVSKEKSRRHIVEDIYAPSGQEIVK